MLLLIDNYDSFTFNLAQYFSVLAQQVLVKRNDSIELSEIADLNPSHIVLSPGPGKPSDAGISRAVIAHFAGRIPILGVCLGHEVIAEYFGAKVRHAEQVMHGKTSLISHDSTSSLFESCPSTFKAARYHSLIVEPYKIPDCLNIIAWTENQQGQKDEIMAISHRELPIFGVQFHPEAILSEQGYSILRNFLKIKP